MAITYQIQPGDTIASIAARFGLDTTKLVSLNPWLTDFQVKISGIGPGNTLTQPPDLITGAGVQLERRPEQSAAAAALSGGEGSDINAALRFVLGEGVNQLDAGLLTRLAPELSAAFEGVNASIITQAEQRGFTAITAPTLTPLEFIQSLQRTGTLRAMLDNPALTGIVNPKPFVTSKRLRF